MTEGLNDPDVVATYAGTRVGLLSTDGDVVLELDLVGVGDRRDAGGWQSFTVTLNGPRDPQLEQSSYLLRFADGREDYWFLVPSAADATSVTYLASFSREIA